MKIVEEPSEVYGAEVIEIISAEYAEIELTKYRL